MSITFRILLPVAALVLTLAACSSNNAGQSASAGKDGVAATVNGVPISERLLNLMLKQRAGLGREVNAEARKAYIDRLAMQLLISQEAVKKGLDKTPEIADQLELMRESVLVDAFVKDYFKSNPVSGEALKAEYEKMKSQATGSEYKARHILVQTDAEAKSIIAKLNKNPQAFAALAKEKSRDPGSKAGGGELGWFDPRGMIPEFGAAVAKLAKGKFTETPVKTQFGYHVILLEDSRPKQLEPLEQLKPSLTQQLQEKNLKKLFEDLKAKAKIEVVQAAVPAPAPEAKPADVPKK